MTMTFFVTWRKFKSQRLWTVCSRESLVKASSSVEREELALSSMSLLVHKCVEDEYCRAQFGREMMFSWRGGGRIGIGSLMVNVSVGEGGRKEEKEGVREGGRVRARARERERERERGSHTLIFVPFLPSQRVMSR